MCVSGCDFLRSIAGRPTSADIEAKRLLIEREEAAHRARLDSLAAIRKQVTDSLALLDSIRIMNGTIVEKRQLNRLSTTSLSRRYYIIVGSFGDRSNALRLSKAIKSKGYETELIPYKNGFTAVGVCPTDSLSSVCASLRKVRGESFCPADAWILNNN